MQPQGCPGAFQKHEHFIRASGETRFVVARDVARNTASEIHRDDDHYARKVNQPGDITATTLRGISGTDVHGN